MSGGRERGDGDRDGIGVRNGARGFPGQREGGEDPGRTAGEREREAWGHPGTRAAEVRGKGGDAEGPLGDTSEERGIGSAGMEPRLPGADW